MFQNTVNRKLGGGVVGEFFSTAPRHVVPGILDSATAGNIIGYAFTAVSNADGHATVGGAIGDGTPFYGILISPKEQALYGTTGGGTLAPTLAVKQYADASFARMGEFWVSYPAACQVGDLVDYVQATGALVTRSPSVANPVAGNVNIPNAKVSQYNLTGAGIGVLALNING